MNEKLNHVEKVLNKNLKQGAREIYSQIKINLNFELFVAIFKGRF